ncbi:MAG: hypothetical protein Q7T34_02120 [Candidatus Parcubacteria bacterium]|nr:hypothetical protein [Candidatus Parcubacteria bacterium]
MIELSEIILIGLSGFTLLISFITAKLEIQIEGKYGWAQNLPTWRKTEGFLVRLQGFPTTGYHTWLNALRFITFNIPMLFFMIIFMIKEIDISLLIRTESLLLGLMITSIVIGNFLWVLLNPYYGIRKFNGKAIYWQKRWIGPFPDWYYLNIIISAILIYFGLPGISF